MRCSLLHKVLGLEVALLTVVLQLRETIGHRVARAEVHVALRLPTSRENGQLVIFIFQPDVYARD